MPTTSDQLSLSGRRWESPRIKTSFGVDGAPFGAALLDELLKVRDLCTEQERQGFLLPSLSGLDEPSMFADMDAAVERACRAISHQEKVVVFGDYDVDGVSSCALMVEVLGQCGLKAQPYIPDRQTEGYGLNATAVRSLADAGTNLLITTDCGIGAHDEIALAASLGVDTIVVDHHLPSDELPGAVACLDPHRVDCRFDFKELCATGLAFFFVCALRRALRDKGHFATTVEPDLRRQLDLVALATVADMMPLHGQNRILVAAGLRQIMARPRPGLLALAAVAGVDHREIVASHLAFKLGPRVNARGRLGHAAEAVELMLTSSRARSRELAELLGRCNDERREVEQAALEEATEIVNRDGLGELAAIVVQNSAWHPGVLGLVATKLSRSFARPAVVIGADRKGSARSLPGLDIHAALSSCRHLFEHFGGHHAAAGLTMVTKGDAVAQLKQELGVAVCEQLGPPPYYRVVTPDAELSLDTLGLVVLDELDKLQPCGIGNPTPLWLSTGVEIVDKRVVGDDHLKLRVGATKMDAIAFGWAEHRREIKGRVDMIYRLSRNSWRGRVSLQLEVEDIRLSPT